MNRHQWELWSDLTFRTQSYRKNFDMITEDENIITEHSGVISKLRVNKHKPPMIIGEYGISVWNIKIAKSLGFNINRLIKKHDGEIIYNELTKNIENKNIDIRKFDKIVFVQNLVVRSDYRKLEVTEEFVEFLYRDFYDEKIAIIALVLPFQYNPIDLDFFTKKKYVEIREKVGKLHDFELVLASKYYALDELIKNKTDRESNEYKLFSVASRCGFNRIDDSHLFMFTPDKTIERIGKKYDVKTLINRDLTERGI